MNPIALKGSCEEQIVLVAKATAAPDDHLVEHCVRVERDLPPEMNVEVLEWDRQQVGMVKLGEPGEIVGGSDLEADPVEIAREFVFGKRRGVCTHRHHATRASATSILAPMRSFRSPLVGLVLLLAACGPGVEPDASGEDIYLQICARCHADNLSGGFGPALVGDDSPSLERPEAYLLQTVRSGLGRMPAFGRTLSDDQIQRVTDFIMDQQGR